jgi:hypothetical protein
MFATVGLVALRTVLVASIVCALHNPYSRWLWFWAFSVAFSWTVLDMVYGREK